MKNQKIAIYAGKGTHTQDFAISLSRMKKEYDFLLEEDIQKMGNSDYRKKYNVLIVPGGFTEKYFSLREKGFSEIRNFVKNGGCYLGMCGGAYLAAKTVELPHGKKEKGLGILDVECQRKYQKRIRGHYKIIIPLLKHPIMKDYQKPFKVWFENGPFIKARKGVQTLAKFKDGSGAIVIGKYGKGKVVLFSVHPEGSYKKGIYPEKIGTLNLLKNAIEFCLG